LALTSLPTHGYIFKKLNEKIKGEINASGSNFMISSQ